MQNINFETLTEEQLKDLLYKVQEKLYGFFGIVEALADIAKEEELMSNYITQKRGRIEENSKQIMALKELGFNMVIYDNDTVAFINFSKTHNGLYCGVEVNKNTNTPNTKNLYAPSGKDMKKIKEILETL